MDTHDLVGQRDTDNGVPTHPLCPQLSLCVSMLTMLEKKKKKGKAKLMLVGTLLFFARNLKQSIGGLLIKRAADI